jgi:cell division protein FtsQ
MTAARTSLRRIVPAVAAVAVTAGLGMGALQGYQYVASQPLKRVVFAGDVDRLPHAELDALALAVQSSGPESATLASVRAAARRVTWVRDAAVRRRFPDTVEITFEAHEALARWSETQLVSTRGEVFAAESPATLPRFRGPEGAAAAMAREYPSLMALLAPLASPIAELRLSARGAWEVALASGLTLELGRGELAARLERFVAAWPRLAVDTKYADLRYPNGFALRATLSQDRGRNQ